jgi:hypothetical protein
MTVYHTPSYTRRSVEEIQDAMRRAAWERAARTALRARIQDAHLEVVGSLRLARHLNPSASYALVLSPYSVTGTRLYARALRLIPTMFSGLVGLLFPHDLRFDAYHLYVWAVLAADLRPVVFIIPDEDWTVGAGVSRLYDRCVRAGLLIYVVGPDGRAYTGAILVLTAPSDGQARYTVHPGTPIDAALQGPDQGPDQDQEGE